MNRLSPERFLDTKPSTNGVFLSHLSQFLANLGHFQPKPTIFGRYGIAMKNP
jgi:hypothetical protein